VQTATSLVEAPATWSDPPETAAGLDSGTSAGETLEISSVAAATLPGPGAMASAGGSASTATAADLPMTMVASESMASQVTAKTLAYGDEAAVLQETAVFSDAGDSASPAAGLPATLADEEADGAGVTAEYAPEGRRGGGRTRPDPFAARGAAGKDGPADYQLLGELGRGGMGIVYKARHRRLNRLVALKMIRAGGSADDIQLARFKIEAEAIAALRHPHILLIYDIGEFNGSPYVALELLEGGSLADRLRRTPLPPRQAAEWLVPLALAMDAAHRAGIVHRDLKSANVLFSAEGVPKITDFGLAKRLEMDEGQTHTGQVMGTPSYMAPEQARGETKRVGPPADIYALGTILYEMLTGRPPFKGVSAMDTVKQVIELDPVAPSRVQYHVPRDLETICLKCLQKEPPKRYPTANELAEDLNRYLAGEPIRARRTPLIVRGIKWARRRPTLATLLGLGILAASALLGTGLWYREHLRAMERIAERHEAAVREETTSDLIRAQEAVSRNDLAQGRVLLTTRKRLLERENRRGLASLAERTGQMLAQVEAALEAERARLAARQAQEEVQRRYRLFLDRRKEALFRDTYFTGLMLPTDHDLTRRAAEAALAVFAQQRHEDDWALGDLSGLSGREQAEVGEGCYVLLLVLAGAVADRDAGQVDRALRILESAGRLRPAPSRAYHLRKASCLARRGDRAGEARELAEAGRLRPQTAFDHFLSGHQEYRRHRLPEAIQDFEAALRLEPDHFWANCLLAIGYLQTSRFEAAKSCLTACLQTDPDFAWLYLLRGFASGQLGARSPGGHPGSPGREVAPKTSAEFEFNEAEADFHEALERLGRTPDDELRYVLLVNRGLTRFQRGQLDQATADYRTAIGLKKDPFLAHAELAHVDQKQDRPAEAIEEFTRAIAVKPDWAPLYRGRAEVRQARADSTPADRRAALADLEMAISHEQPDNPVLAQDHTNRGKLLEREGRLEEALEESQLALGVLANYGEAHVLRIQILLKLMRYDDVIRSCDVALAQGKKSSLLYELRGLAHAARDDYPGAVQDYSRALELRPDDRGPLLRRGWAYLVVDAPRLALVDFDAAIRLDAAEADAYNGRGTARVRIGDHRGAVADAREALRLGQANSRVKYNAARIYAMAAPVVAAEVGPDARRARLLASHYQDLALQLIREAWEGEAPEKRPEFWSQTIEPDPAFKSIRRRLRLEAPIPVTRRPGS
jgi:tetratricopeptide (TPR) repeat protein/tRNA A-37 threonylcarbamoyl transferase component Bud32